MLARVKRARQHLDALRVLLLSPAPEPLEALPSLEDAAENLRDLQKELQNHLHAGSALSREIKAELRRELHALARQIAIAARLNAAGAEFHQGWARMLGAHMAGYTPAGAAVPLTPPASVSVEG